MSADGLSNEQNFIGCLLRSPHDYWKISDLVQADMLTVPHLRKIFEAVALLSIAARPVSRATLKSALPDEFDDVGPADALLATLKINAVDAGSASDYAPFLAERSAMSKLDALGVWLKKEVSSGIKTMEDVATDATSRLQEIMASASPNRPVKLSALTKEAISFSARAAAKEIMPGYTTGLIGLDAMIGLLMGGDLIGVMAALGEGKSALLSQIGIHIARSGPVLACHNEMSPEQNAVRAVAGFSGLSVKAVRQGEYDFEAADRIRAAQALAEGLDLSLYTNPRMTVRDIRARAIQMKRTTGLAAITVDGMKRLRTHTKTRDKWERMEEITGELKAMAIEFNVPVLLAVHRTRGGRRRDDPTPQLDDADAPSLEGDADIIIGVWQEYHWLMLNKPSKKSGGVTSEAHAVWNDACNRVRGKAKMIGLKVRSGSPYEERDFKFNGAATRFEDVGAPEAAPPVTGDMLF